MSNLLKFNLKDDYFLSARESFLVVGDTLRVQKYIDWVDNNRCINPGSPNTKRNLSIVEEEEYEEESEEEKQKEESEEEKEKEKEKLKGVEEVNLESKIVLNEDNYKVRKNRKYYSIGAAFGVVALAVCLYKK